jgi:hypothetical protein
MLAGGAGMTASASASDGTGSSATAGVSAGADLSGGVERSMTASNVSATPPGNATHPPLRNAEMTGSRNRWTREAGWGGNDGSGASPFHSHKPGSWFSSLGDVVWDDTITGPSSGPKCSACLHRREGAGSSALTMPLHRQRRAVPSLRPSEIRPYEYRNPPPTIPILPHPHAGAAPKERVAETARGC